MNRLIRFLAAVLGLIVSTQGADLAGRRPNIIFILTDDQGYGDLSAHGNPILRTPNLDRLHDEGVRFTDFQISPASAGTRAALLTGRHEFKNGVTHARFERERLAPDAITIAQVLKKAGYATGIFGEWHLGDEAERWPSARGFDEMFIHGGGGLGETWPGSCGDAPGNTCFAPALLHNGTFVKTQGYCTDIFFSRAIEWMDDQLDAGIPFFAYLATNAPHEPRQVPFEDQARYAGKVPPDTAKFFGTIANLDDNVGRLLEKLDEWGIAQKTLIVFMTGNSGSAGGNVLHAGLRGVPGTPWPGGTRAASFWRWPGALTPHDVPALAAHLDFFPTLAELAGAKLDDATRAQVEGRSLVPLLAEAGADWPERTLFTHAGGWPKGADSAPAKYAHCAVRTPRWHLVCDSAGEKQWQLFDLPADPGEARDLAAEHPEIVAQLDAAYDRWWAAAVPLMINEKAPLPKMNPLKKLYWSQFGGSPSAADLEKMDPKNVPKN